MTRPHVSDHRVDGSNPEMHSYFRQASVTLQEVIRRPGVWDPFVLAYVDVSHIMIFSQPVFMTVKCFLKTVPIRIHRRQHKRMRLLLDWIVGYGLSLVLVF